MKIGIDCRMYGLKHAGIGRYVLSLVENLLVLDKENEYVLFMRKEFEEIKSVGRRTKFKIIEVDAAHYSLKEQLLFPFFLYKEKLDLVHFPHFNVPVFYFGKYVVTIHDLIKHTSRGIATTTRSGLVYWPKYFGYKLVFWLAVKRAAMTLVPSRFVKEELVKQYHLDPGKVRVTYEGVDTKISNKTQILEKYKIQEPYLLYVGSVYPHKNIENLIEAVKILKINLVIVCGRSVFWERLKKKVGEMGAGEIVNLVGFVPDEELSMIYQQAEAFVFPSLSEGFGLPGLEAMVQGTPVAASDIPVFREIYKNAAIYFNPLSSADMADKIKKLLQDKELQQRLKKRGLELAEGYSWKKMASETLLGYNQALK